MQTRYFEGKSLGQNSRIIFLIKKLVFRSVSVISPETSFSTHRYVCFSLRPLYPEPAQFCLVLEAEQGRAIVMGDQCLQHGNFEI